MFERRKFSIIFISSFLITIKKSKHEKFQTLSINSKIENKDLIIKLIERHARPASEEIIDDVDLHQLLKISRRTSLEYRKKGIFKFYKLDNKIFYILEEVIAGIKEKGRRQGNFNTLKYIKISI